MELLGEVRAIINEELILISSQKNLEPDDVVTVFTNIRNDKLKETGIDQLVYPKGEIQIVCNQGNDIYLAKKFREKERTEKRVVKPSAVARALTGAFGPLTAEQIEYVDVYGPWSSEFDRERSLDIKISKIVTIGDLVGRI